MTVKIFTTLIMLQFVVSLAWAGPTEDAMLREAAMNLDVVAVQAALKKGANPNAASSDRWPFTSLQAVMWGMPRTDPNRDIKSEALEIVKALFSHGAKVGVSDGDILWLPISQGDVQLVSLLLDRGASPTAKINGYTLTELAAQHQQNEVYDLLVSQGGIPVDKRSTAQLIFVEAAARGDIAGMERSVKAGASIDDADASGRTALINTFSVRFYGRRHAEAAWWLLDAGADPNVKAESRFTGVEGIPLHIFVVLSRGLFQKKARALTEKTFAIEETFARLLQAGAKVSGMDSKGRTPLHVAARWDNMRAAEILIREGARVMARDEQGRTPLDYAESALMIQLLKKHGAREH